MKDLATISRILFSLSLLALAAAVVYFTLEVSSVRTSLPELLEQIDATSHTIEPIIVQIENINQQIPNILEEVKQIRKLVPPILTEVSAFRKEIPPILIEVEQTRKIIPNILQEVGQTRQQIPPILAEVKATRESLPDLLEKGNALVSNARNAGKEASQGAVSGFFSGLFRAPFAIVGDIGSSIYGFSSSDKNEYAEEDLSTVYKAGVDLLESDKINKKIEITSTDGKIQTTLTLIAIDTSGEYPCKTLHAHSIKEGKVITDKKSILCKNSDDKWENENI